MRAHEAGALHGDLGSRGPAWLRTPHDINALEPLLWPSTVRRSKEGSLTVGGLDVRDLAATHGTPAYVLDEADLRERVLRGQGVPLQGDGAHHRRGGPESRRVQRRRAHDSARRRLPAGAHR